MSSADKRHDPRTRKLARTAYRLHQAGHSNDAIAIQLSIDVEVVPARVKLGERLVDAEL